MNSRPIIWLTIVFSLGITLSKNLPLPIWALFPAVLIIFGLTVYAILQKLEINYFLLTLIFLIGALSFQLTSLPTEDPLACFLNKGYQTFQGQIDEAPKKLERGVSFPLRLERGLVYVWSNDLAAIEYGDKVEVRGVLTQTTGFSNPLMPEARELYKLNASYIEKISSGGSFLKKIAIWFSQRFNSVLIQILPPKEAALLGSILLGTSVSPIDYGTKDQFRQAGIIHLVVASGTQVSILIGVCLSLVKMCRLPNNLAIFIASLFNMMLVVITGGGASILRAAIMGEIMLLGLLFERQGEVYTTLSLSALVLLIMNPAILFDIGFQLSFAATWSLVYIVPVFEQVMPNILAATLAPILVSTPISAYNFSQVSPGGIVSNLIILSWVEFLTVYGFLTTIIGFVFLPLAGLLANTLWLLLVFLEKLVAFIPALPGACFYIAAPSFIVLVAYYAGLVIVVERMRNGASFVLTRKRLAFAFLFFCCVFIWDKAFSTAPLSDKQLTVTFIDVGQGDSILIETPGGKKVLIDAGGKDSGESGDRGNEVGSDPVGERVIVPFLHRKGINRLDLAILTHPHADHLGGLNKVLEEVQVDEVLDSGQDYKTQAYWHFKDLIKANNIKLSIGRAGEVINFENDLAGYILNPAEPLLGDTNSDSIVMRLVYGDISFLFTGDMEHEGEQRVLSSPNSVLSSTILKIGHHGSRTSTSDEFLQTVNPRFAVISCGAHNRYRHPHNITLEKLAVAGKKTYRTDQNGAVVVRTDGRQVAIETQK